MPAMSDLFAQLARRALQTRALGPRMPSRYETLAAAAITAKPADVDGAGGSANADAIADTIAPIIAMRSAPVAMPNPAAPADPSRPSAVPARIDAPLFLPRAAAARVRAEDAALPAAAPQGTAPMPDRHMYADGLRQAQASMAGLPALNGPPPAASRPAPIQPPTTIQSTPSTTALSQQQPTTPPAPATDARFEALRGPTLTRLDALAPPRVAVLANVTPPALRDSTPAWTSATLPRVDITIGSIDIVVAPATAAPPARPAAAPVQTPSVQSLDAYLQSRQGNAGRPR